MTPSTEPPADQAAEGSEDIARRRRTQGSRPPRRNGEGYGKLYRWVIDAEISAHAKLLFAVLDDYADEHGRCFPGIEELRRKVGVRRKRISALIRELEQLGAVTVERRSGRVNRYRIHTSVPNGTSADPVTTPVSQTALGRADRDTRSRITKQNHISRSRDDEEIDEENPEPKPAPEVNTVDANTLTKLQRDQQPQRQPSSRELQQRRGGRGPRPQRLPARLGRPRRRVQVRPMPRNQTTEGRRRWLVRTLRRNPGAI
jgi:DNA-binding transcriptional ArsR family regulator